MSHLTLISGGTGFLGSYIICRLLKQGKKVRAIRRPSSRMNEFDLISRVNMVTTEELKNLEWRNADILNTADLEELFEDVSEVIHAAAIVSFLPGDKYRLLENNITGTANLVNLSLQHGIKKFGYISSVAALGRSDAEDPMVTEKNIWEESRHNTSYAVSKHLAELEVWRGIAEGLNAVIVNPGIILGVGDFNRNTGKIFGVAWKEIKFYTPGITGFVDVRDVAKVITELMDKNIFNERFILVSENLPFRELYNRAADAFKKRRPGINTPRWMANFGYRGLALLSGFTGKEPLLTKETTNAAYNKFYYDNSRIRKALDFEFIPIDETIRWTCEWFVKENQLQSV
jgi:dihydroflavonol-4-reductase